MKIASFFTGIFFLFSINCMERVIEIEDKGMAARKRKISEAAEPTQATLAKKQRMLIDFTGHKPIIFGVQEKPEVEEYWLTPIATGESRRESVPHTGALPSELELLRPEDSLKKEVMEAACKGDIAKFAYYIAYNKLPNLNMPLCIHGSTALSTARAHGKTKLVEFLVAHGAFDGPCTDLSLLDRAKMKVGLLQPNYWSEQLADRRKRLHQAAISGEVARVGVILSEGFGVNWPLDETGCRLLDIAIEYGHADLITCLEQDGAKRFSAAHFQEVLAGAEVKSVLAVSIAVILQNPHLKFPGSGDYDGIIEAKFFQAVEDNDSVLVWQLLAKFPFLFFVRDEMGRLPMHACAKLGHVETLSVLMLGEFAQLYYEPDLLGHTILHYAVMSGNRDAVDFLISRFPSLIEMCDSAQQTPLQTAQRLHRHVIEFLLSNK